MTIQPKTALVSVLAALLLTACRPNGNGDAKFDGGETPPRVKV